MTDPLEVFAKMKELAYGYPQEKFPFGSSPCHYWHGFVREPFHQLMKQTKPDVQYLELGSFLGAGSTATALQANPTLRAVCCDHFNLKYNKIFEPENAYEPGTARKVDFIRGVGSPFEHFINNTWEWKDRIAPFKVVINKRFLQYLYDQGYRPDVILVDDDHRYQPVIDRLDIIKDLWPTSLIIMDDFVPEWEEVRQAVYEVFRKGWYRKADSELLGGRLLVLKGSSPEYVKARAAKDAEAGGDAVAGTET